MVDATEDLPIEASVRHARFGRARTVSAISKGLFVLGSGLLWLWFALGGSAPAALGLFSIAAALGVLAASSRLRRAPRWAVGMVRLREPGCISVEVEGRLLVLDRADLSSALIVERFVDGKDRLVIEVDDVDGAALGARDLVKERVVLRIASEDEARRVYAHLEAKSQRAMVDLGDVQSSRRMISAVIASAMAFWVAAWLQMILGGVLTGVLMVFPVLPLTLYEAMKPLLRPARLTVGRDGVRLSRGGAISFNELSANGMERGAAPLRAWLKAKMRPYMLRTFDLDRPRFDAATERAVTLLETVIEVEPGRRAAYRSGVEGGGVQYRVSAPTTEEAVDVLRSAVSSAEERAGAVRVLSHAGVEQDEIDAAIAASADDDTAKLLAAARLPRR